jgi:hypothetical protein
MKLQFLLAGIVATGLFASAPDTAHGGFGGGGGGRGGAAEAVTAARFTVAAEAFMAVVVSGAFTAIAVFSAMIVFSFPVSVSMGTRGGGIGVIRTILTTRTITQITPAHTTVTMRTRAIDS